MKKHETVLERPTSGEVVDFISAAMEQLSPVIRGMSRKEIRYWISGKGRLGKAFRKALQSSVYAEVLAEWERFYLKFFNMDLNLSAVAVPDHEPGFDRVIVVPQALTLNQAVSACKEKGRFPVYSYWGDDLDHAVTANDRSPSGGSYAVRVRDRVEADEELKNLSAIQLAESRVAGITLAERIVYELKYFDETGKHLDIDNITLCSGSCATDGIVPGVCWRVGGLCFDGYSPRFAYADLRARAVVSV